MRWFELGGDRETARPWRRLAPLVLVAGVLLAGSQVMPHVPHDRTVELRLDDPSTVTRIDLAWAERAQGRGPGDQGGSWRFASGGAPSSIRTSVRLPDGRYDLDVTVERGAERSEIHRVITLGDAERISVPIR